MTRQKRGFFITLEGGEGSGKTTQIGLLKTYFEDLGKDVLTTREPGGTPEAETLRTLLVTDTGNDWSPMAEALLLFAAREMHVRDMIKPALDEGKIVISDRFADSTRAYQSYGHGVPLNKIDTLYQTVLGDFAPDITLILDIPPEEGVKRAQTRLKEQNSAEARFENLDLSFHHKLRQGYLEIARQNPERCVIIDALQTQDAVQRDIENAINRLI